MAVARLIPSTYALSNSSYLSVSNADNMYNNTDNETYATVTNSRKSTSSYYVYLRGFNFEEIPNSAVVSEFAVKLKARESGVSTSDSYKPYLANGTSAINGSCSALSTTTTTYTFSGLSADWGTIKGYGNNFGIRINCRRASKNTTSYVYIYGAEIEVTYTVPDPRTITTTLSGNGTISPSGSTTTYDGETFELTITPTDKSEQVTITRNGTDVTSELVSHGAGDSVTFTPTDVTTSNISSGSSYAEYAIGKSAEDPSSSGSSSNIYAPSGSTGYAAYSFDFSSIPSNATIEELSVAVYGHRESATIDSTHVSSITLYNGSTAISDVVDFPSTSNDTINVEATTVPTRSQLDNVVMRHTVGYYGGLILGATMTVVYSTGTGTDHYTYTFTVSGDATIAVTIGSSASAVMYFKNNGTWTAATKVYKKVNGSWVEQSDLSTVFNTNTNYIKG